jgi:hypothetical protein
MPEMLLLLFFSRRDALNLFHPRFRQQGLTACALASAPKWARTNARSFEEAPA